MSLRDRLRRLEKAAEGDVITIPLRDGGVARFPAAAGMEAFSNMMERLGAGEDAPPEHPLIEAARNSSEPKWSKSFFAVNDPTKWTEPIPDLSE